MDRTPGAVLLRHQAARRPVGEAGNDALQMRELLVEIGAQPLQLVMVAEIFGGDDFVELRREGVIFRPARLVLAVRVRTRRPPGVSSSPSSPSSNVSEVEACALSIALSLISSDDACAWSALISCAASESGEPSAPD